MTESQQGSHADPKPPVEFSDSTKVVVAKNNVYCELDGESVILNIADGVYYGLNVVGHRIWEMIQEPKTIAELTRTLTQDFEVEPAECQKDVEELLRDLLQNQLIEVLPPG